MAVTNGDFETGDFTGWTVDNYGTPTTDTVDATAKYSGSYGWHFKCQVSSGQVVQADHYQTVDFTSIPSLKFRLNIISRTVTGDGIAKVTVRIDADENSYTTTTGYQEITIDTSSYSGNKTLEFVIDTQSYSSGTASLEGYIDDIATGAAVPPTADFTSSAGTDTLEITFTDTSTATPTSWAWSFGDGDTSTDQNPIHTYDAGGIYTVSLTATNGAGSSTPKTVQLQVYGHTTIPFTHGTVEYTQGETITITDEHTFTTPTTSYKIYAYWTAGSANLTDMGTGGESGATCVLSWVESVHDALYILTLTNVSGTFTDGEIITFSDGVHNTGYYEFDRNYEVSIELPSTSYRTPQAGDTVTGVSSGHTGTVTGVSQSGGTYTIFISSNGGFDGENVTLTPSGGATTVTGEVDTVTLTGGSYGAGTAYGTIDLINTTAEIPPGYISGTTSGSNVGYTGGEYPNYTNSGKPYIIVSGDSDSLGFTYATVSRNISESCWKAEVTIPSEYVPPVTDDMPVITITVPDHTNTDQTIFYGVIAGINYTQTPTGLTTNLICYDYAYYLVAQYVPILSTMYSSSGSVYEPSLVIKRLLGTDTSATDYDHITGIYPYNIDVVSGWGSSTSGSLATKDWSWTPKTRKWSALSDIAEYTNYLFYVYWKYNDPLTNEWCPVAYFVLADDIDTGSPLDLPSKVTCTASTDPYMVSKITSVNQNDYKYNTVKIYGGLSSGTTLTSTSSGAGVGTIIKPIEYIEENDAWITQAECDDVASAYLDYLSTPGDIYQTTFINRTDLRLLQQMSFSGYDQVPDDDMRITAITYTILPGYSKVDVTFTTDRKFHATRKLNKVVNPTLLSEVNQLIQQRQNELLKPVLGETYTYSSGTGVFKDSYGYYHSYNSPT